MTFLKRISELEKIPNWYGMAYREPQWCGAIFAPIPFNWVVGWAHRLYWGLVKGPRELTDAAYRAGYAAAEQSMEIRARSHRDQDRAQALLDARRQVYDELMALTGTNWQAEWTVTEKKH